MDPISAALFIYNLPLIDKIIDATMRYGFNQLKSKTIFFRLIRELGLEHPKDDDQSVYLNSVFTFAANSKHRELIKLMLLKSSIEAFHREVKHFEVGVYKWELDSALHVNPVVREIKHWNEVPRVEIEEFFAIYNEITRDVANPSQTMIMATIHKLTTQVQDLREFNQKEFSSIKESVESKNLILATADSTDPLQKEYDRQINVISDSISKAKYCGSLDQLQGLRKAIWENADSSIRFKLLTNIGVCLFELGQDKAAADVLIQAYGFNSDSEVALSNLVNAYGILDDLTQAQAHLKIAIEKFGETSQITWASYINLSSIDRSMEDVISELPQSFLDKSLVLMNIGLAYRKRGEFDSALEYAQRAYDLDSDDHKIADHYIKLRLEQYNYDFKKLNQHILNDKDKEDIDDLLGLLEQRYEALKETDLKDDTVFVLLSKGYLLNLIGKSDEAMNVTDKGLLIDPINAFLLRQKALIYASKGDSGEVVKQLLSIPNLDDVPGGRVFLAEAYAHVGRINEAIQIFEDILYKGSDPFLMQQAKEMVVSLYIKEGLADKLVLLKAKGYNKNDILDGLCYARILQFEGKADEARELLLELKSKINNNNRYKEILFLADELVKYDLLADAAQLYDMIVEQDVDSYMSEKLYKLYYQIGEKAKALSILQRLRVANGPLRLATKDEIIIYQEYSDYDKARELTKLYLESYPDDLSLKLTLSALNIRLGYFSESDMFLRDEIDYLILPQSELSVYVAQLRSRGMHEKAIEVTYEFRRKMQDSGSNDLYILTFLEYPSTTKPFVVSNKVTKHSAVTLSHSTAPKYTLIVEDKPVSEIVAGEISLFSEDFLPLRGKKVGEKVILNERFKKEWVISEINNRYFHAFRDAQDKSSTIFQGQSSLQTFHVDDFWNVVGQVGDKDWGRKYDEIMTYYLQKRIGIGFLSERLGRNPIDLWNELSKNPNKGIQSVLGTNKEMKAALELLKGDNKPLCADITALLLVFEMEIGDLIVNQYGKMVIATTTEDVIHDYKEEVLRFSQTGLLPDRFQAFIEFVNKYTSVCNPNVLRLNSTKKAEIDNLLGKSFFDTILLAEEQGGFVYSEDYVTKAIAGSEHKINGLWTQPILASLNLKNVITSKEYEQKNMQLVERNIRHTSISHSTLIEALKLSNKFYQTPFAIVINSLQGKITSAHSAFLVCLRFLGYLWSDNSMKDNVKEDISIRVFEVLCTDREINQVFNSITRFLRIVENSSEDTPRRWVCYNISKSLDEFRQLYRIPISLD